MKRLQLFIVLLGGMMMLQTSVSCSKDESWPEVDGADPLFSTEQPNFSIEAGTDVRLKAKIEDADGIASIQLVCPSLYLDKTIDIVSIYGEPLVSYDLDYKISISRDEIADSFTIDVIVTDTGGRTTEGQFIIALDADYTDPVFTLKPSGTSTVLIKEQTILNLRFTVTDNKSLDRITIDVKDEAEQSIDGFPEELTASGSQYTYSKKVSLPSEEGEYEVTITAYDKKKNSVKATSVVTVSELPDFEKMYLADVENAADLNSDIMGVPMLVERTGEYQYKAKYYNAAAGTKIRFIPQKTDFYPICFGTDPENTESLTDDPDVSQPIVLNEPNVYYVIEFNTKTGVYSTSTYSVDEAVDPLPHAFGSNSLDTWEDGGSWLQEFYFGIMESSPKEIIRFVQDKTNPHVFRTEEPIVYTKGKKLNFVIHNWHHDGWWDYCSWRVDNSDEPERWIYRGKKYNVNWTGPHYNSSPKPDDNWAKPTVPATGSYTFYFDAHLGYSKFIPAK